MKYIFVDSYSLIWNGYTSRYEKGISGSHNSIMYLAEGLAMDLNNEVITVSTHNNLIEGEYLNVKYINYCNFNVTNCDYIVMLNNLNSLYILNKERNLDHSMCSPIENDKYSKYISITVFTS